MKHKKVVECMVCGKHIAKGAPYILIARCVIKKTNNIFRKAYQYHMAKRAKTHPKCFSALIDADGENLWERL